MLNMLQIRYGWYQYRKEQGHPISVWRAFFTSFPRFSSYERHEVGCPYWALRCYERADGEVK